MLREVVADAGCARGNSLCACDFVLRILLRLQNCRLTVLWNELIQITCKVGCT
jgi:hypothetical protein